MSMRVHESAEDYLSCAIDFDNFLAVLFDPGIAQCVFALAGRDNLSAYAENRAILDDAEALEIGAAARAGVSGRGPQGHQLADVHQQQRTIGWCFVFRRRSHADLV